jgi:16S rRNA (adenine1518-N6/adenine1519-N6)-dimethyltransferase
LTLLVADALGVETLPGRAASALVANLPYAVAVKVLLAFLERFETIRRALVMVQAEVAERLVARPGSRVYGVPSVKLAWWGEARLAGRFGRAAFYPVPRVDSALVYVERRDPPACSVSRERVFSVVDAAFATRRKTLRSALAPLAGGPAGAEAALRAAGIDPAARGETLAVADFARLASCLGDGAGLDGEAGRAGCADRGGRDAGAGRAGPVGSGALGDGAGLDGEAGRAGCADAALEGIVDQGAVGAGGDASG